MGLQEIRKLLFPIGRYPPRCDKRRKRDDRRLFFFPSFARSPPFAFSNDRRLHEVIFLRGGPRCVGGHVSKAPGFLSLDKSHIPLVSLPRSRYLRPITFRSSDSVRTWTAERLVRSITNHVEMLTLH